MSSRLSSNSESFASELLENLEEMFCQYYYMHGNVFGRFNSSNTHGCVTRPDDKEKLYFLGGVFALKLMETKRGGG